MTNSSFVVDDSQSMWSDGQSMSYGWHVLQSILYPTFGFNTAVVILIMTSNKLQNSCGTIVKYLCLQDALFSLLCAAQCTINAAWQGIWLEQAGCNIQSIYHQLLALSIGCTLALASYNSYRLVKLKAGLPPRQVFRFHIIIWIICFIIAFVCGAVIGDAPLVPSGIYCFVSLMNWKQGIMFFIPLALIVAFIIHRYAKLFLYIRRAANSAHFSDAACRAAHDRQLRAARRMVLLVVLFLSTSLPWLIISLGEVIASSQASGMVHFLVGATVHLNSLFDPIIYLVMTKPARERIYEIVRHVKFRILYGRDYQRKGINAVSVSPLHPKRELTLGTDSQAGHTYDRSTMTMTTYPGNAKLQPSPLMLGSPSLTSTSTTHTRYVTIRGSASCNGSGSLATPPHRAFPRGPISSRVAPMIQLPPLLPLQISVVSPEPQPPKQLQTARSSQADTHTKEFLSLDDAKPENMPEMSLSSMRMNE